MGVWEAIVMAISLCADCFAVSVCSSLGLRRIELRKLLTVALAFAVIQSGLLMVGWTFGSLIAGLVMKISSILAFCLLLYVGSGMIKDAVSALRGGECECRDLNGFKNIVLGGIATSLDALAVGVSMSLVPDTASFAGILPLLVSVFAVTALSVIAGMTGGKAIGQRFGHWAELAGGIVLIIIGILIVIGK